MREYFIYKYEWPDGSVYIGQSYIGSGRYGDATRYTSSPRVYNKMKKYPDFNKEILVSGLSETEVDDFEIYYIKVYNSYKGNNRKYGLNLTTGGSGCHGLKHSEETKKKISEFNKGKKLPEKEIERLRIAMSGENNPMYGKRLSDEEKEKLSKLRKGKFTGVEHHASKEVHKYTLDGKYLATYNCVKDAERELGLTHNSVCHAANPNDKTHVKAGGFKWRYYKVDILDKEA